MIIIIKMNTTDPAIPPIKTDPSDEPIYIIFFKIIIIYLFDEGLDVLVEVVDVDSLDEVLIVVLDIVAGVNLINEVLADIICAVLGIVLAEVLVTVLAK